MLAWGKSWPVAPSFADCRPDGKEVSEHIFRSKSRFEPVMFSLFVSMMMTFVVSGVSTHSNIFFEHFVS